MTAEDDIPVVEETVPAVLEGERIDRLVAMLLETTRGRAADLIDGSAVTIDDQIIRTRSRKVQEGQVIRVRATPNVSPGMPEPDSQVRFEVVAEDAGFLVVDKPAGLVVHPGAGNEGATLVNGLLARYPDLTGVGAPDRPGIVHRLDAGTSGLMVVARTPDAYESLVGQLAARTVRREYLALLSGCIIQDTGVIDAPLGRGPRDRTRMAVTAEGKEARTSYEVKRRFGRPFPSTFVRCRLETGRTHQIRVHVAAIGHPVIGDKRYGGPSLEELDRPFLHAAELQFRHPVTGEELRFNAPLPGDLEAALARFTEKRDQS